MGRMELFLFIVFCILLLSGDIFSQDIDVTSKEDSGARNFNKILLDKDQQEVPSFQNKYNIIEEKDKVDKPKRVMRVSPLAFTEDDLLWEFAKDGSYVDLFIRKKPKTQSVMLTNMYYGSEYASKYGSRVYGLRAQRPNPVNSHELRIINKKKVWNKSGHNFIVDSSPERHKVFGLAFRLRIPRLVEYGYKALGVSHGLITLGKGVTFNLRSYDKKYADNSGNFYNNPVYIDFTAKTYYERLRPNLKRLSSYKEGPYNVIVIQYKSRINYVKHFLLRDFQKSTFFKRIQFISPNDNTSDKDKKGLILRAIRNKEGYVYITALIYLKDSGVEQEYNIAAIDEEDRISKNYLSVIVFHSPKEPDSKFIPKGDVIIIDNSRLQDSRLGNEEGIYFEDN